MLTSRLCPLPPAGKGGLAFHICLCCLTLSMAFKSLLPGNTCESGMGWASALRAYLDGERQRGTRRKF